MKKFNKFRVSVYFLPQELNSMQYVQIAFQIGKEVLFVISPEFIGAISNGLFFIDQLLNGRVVVIFQQFKNFIRVLLADIDIAFLKFLNKHFVRMDKTIH